jgi:hypothetical protein
MGTDVFDGNYATATDTIGNEAAEVRGKKTFCVHRASEDTYHSFTVLIAR